jgi:GDP-4-dehydro-6-deoxy-D-mannose reductase
MSRRALITGATGFVGRILTAHLAERGWDTVGWGYPPGPDALPCDLSDRDQVRAAFAQSGQVTHVFHLAALTFVPDALRAPAAAMRVNYEGTVNLAETLCAESPESRLIYVGSAEVYGPPQSLPVTEDHPLRPANPYAISKAAADHYCAYLTRSGALDVVRMRPFNHSGPGQSDQFVLSSFARQVAEIEAGHHESILRVGNLASARDFLHVNDVVRAYERAALQGRTGEAYNICSGRAWRIQEALDILLRLSRVPITVFEDPERLRPVDVPEVYGSHAKLTTDTGWTPALPFEQLLEELLDAWRGSTGAQR